MLRIIRNIIAYDEAPNLEALRYNMRKLDNTSLDWDMPVDSRIYGFVSAHFSKYFEAPNLQLVIDYFEARNDPEAIERLNDAKAIPTYYYSNFLAVLSEIKETQSSIKAVAVFKEAQEIALKGLTLKDGRDKIKLQGVNDAFKYIANKSIEVIRESSNARLRGTFRADAEEVWQDYLEAKTDKSRSYGKATGFEEIDRICHGIKKGELWVHAAYAGELKTSFATNWCYNLITRYRSNVYYASLEMKYSHIRRLIYVIHSANKLFQTEAFKQAYPNLKPAPLDYRKVRDGELSPEEEEFFKIVCTDFAENSNYCDFDTWAPDSDVTIRDLQVDAELVHQQKELGLIVVDHGGLAEAQKGKKNRDYTIELNSVIRDAKKLALHFNGGEGIGVALLFQINREGKDAADKNDGVYKMRALAQSNEAERSADIITTTYLNADLRKEGQAIFANLKNRDNPLIEPFRIGVDFTSRRLYNLNPFSGNNQNLTLGDYQARAQALQDL